MGSETDTGYWNNPYKVQFPFVINGKQYFYGQNTYSYYWFIQELLPGGKMGCETDNGHWNNPYEVQFPFKVNGQQYFYGHNTSSNYWFIQELPPEGKMGGETDNGHWNNAYKVQFPFVINSQQYFYGQNLSSNYWFIQKLLLGGRMGEETDNGYWNNPYGAQFIFPKSIYGHLYFYGQNLSTNYWFVQELVLNTCGNCTMGDEVANGRWQYPYKVQLPFTLGDVAYWYGSNTSGNNWFIQELVSLEQYTIRKFPIMSVPDSSVATNDGTCNNEQTSPKYPSMYAVGWVPYLADWKNYIKNYGLFSGFRYHDPSELQGVGVLVGLINDELYGDQLKSKQCEKLIPYRPEEGHYSWALVPGGKILYVWNCQLQLDERNYIRHSELNKGSPVVCAGEFTFSTFPTTLDGVYIELNDSSGHYKPDGKMCFSFVIDAFKDLGIDTSKVIVKVRNP